ATRARARPVLPDRMRKMALAHREPSGKECGCHPRYKQVLKTWQTSSGSVVVVGSVACALPEQIKGKVIHSNHTITQGVTQRYDSEFLFGDTASCIDSMVNIAHIGLR